MPRHPEYKNPPEWRWESLLEGLGSAQQVSDEAFRRGYPRLPLSTIWNWRARGSIPAMWVPVMLQMALDARLINRIEDLRITRRNDNAKTLPQQQDRT
jgi:hypothetical protein